MHIQENLTNYRIIIYPEDIREIGYTFEQIIENLIEASGLINKPLGKYEYTYDPKDMSYVVFIEKEF